MENLLNESELNTLQVNKQSKVFLKEIAKWARFLSIIGFIGVGFMVILAFSIGSVMNYFYGLSPMGAMYGAAMGGVNTSLTVIYLLFAVLYFFPVYYFYNFSVNLKSSLASENTSDLTKAFESLKSHYKFLGIFTIVILSLYALIFLLALLGSAL